MTSRWQHTAPSVTVEQHDKRASGLWGGGGWGGGGSLFWDSSIYYKTYIKTKAVSFLCCLDFFFLTEELMLKNQTIHIANSKILCWLIILKVLTDLKLFPLGFQTQDRGLQGLKKNTVFIVAVKWASLFCGFSTTLNGALKNRLNACFGFKKSVKILANCCVIAAERKQSTSSHHIPKCLFLI